MADPVAVTISALALAVSATTAWLTLFRRGTVKMTQPTVIYFGPDTPPARDVPAPPKIYLRTLLFATSKRGRVIESMHVRLMRNEMHQNFNIWVHGDATLVRGSGLFVGETGVAANHHFLTPGDAREFRFTEDQYRIEVFVHLLGDSHRTLTVRADVRSYARSRSTTRRPRRRPVFRLGTGLLALHPAHREATALAGAAGVSGGPGPARHGALR